MLSNPGSCFIKLHYWLLFKPVKLDAVQKFAWGLDFMINLLDQKHQNAFFFFCSFCWAWQSRIMNFS